MTRPLLVITLFFLLLLPAFALAAFSERGEAPVPNAFDGDAASGETVQNAQKAGAWEAVPADAAAKIQDHLRREMRSFKNTEGGRVSASTEGGDLKLDADLRATRFTSGKDWFALTLEYVGREDAMRKIAAPVLHADGAKLELVREGMTEWYVNHGASLEHGLVLRHKPEGAGSLRFSFATSGNLVPQQSRKDIAFVGDRTVRYSGIKAWDAAGTNLTCALSVERGNVVWTVDDSQAQYPVTVDPSVSLVRDFLESSSWAYGADVSVYGDSILVGARVENNTGAAYLYSKDQGGDDYWGLVQKFEGETRNGYFGGSVALSGDYALVGANGADAAYLYYKNQGGADQWGLLKKIEELADSEFGISVSLDGDYAVVGATYENSRTGAAYFYYKDEGGTNQWGRVQRQEGPGTYSYFGQKVCIAGDEAIVGAYMAGSADGGAYIYHKDQGGVGQWGLAKTLVSPVADSEFGSDVTIDHGTALVGAAAENRDTGAAYIFYRDQGGADQWGHVKRLEGGVAASQFGKKVSLSDNLALVGAEYENDQAGAVYTYGRDIDGDDQWGLVRKLQGVGSGDSFGGSVSASGFYAAIGVPGSDAGMTDLYKAVVAAPVTSGTTAQTYKNTPVQVDLREYVANGFDALGINDRPGNGAANVSGSGVTYTPNDGFEGEDSFTYIAGNDMGESASATVTVTVIAPVITVAPTTMANAILNRAYSRTLSADGGISPYLFFTSVASGDLPPGLTLDSTGVISGTPTAAGEYTFTVSGVDYADTEFTSSPITISVIEASPMPEGALMLLLGTL